MDRKLIDALIYVLNTVKRVYDMTFDKDEDIVRPLMNGAIIVAHTLDLPHDKEEDEQSIDQWIHVSDKRLIEINESIKDRFPDDGDAS